MHVMSKAKRLICKKLGVVFEEAASDDAAMLARYAAAFDKINLMAQIDRYSLILQLERMEYPDGVIRRQGTDVI